MMILAKRYFWWLPTLCIAGMIFYSSSQPYTQQDIRPYLSNQFELEWINTYFSFINFDYAGKEISVDNLGPAGFIEFFVRKAAHFCTNLALGICTYFALRGQSNKSGKFIYSAWLLTILFACSDEYHQSLTGDRTPLYQDVVLDSIGAFVGIMLGHIWRKRNNSRIFQ